MSVSFERQTSILDPRRLRGFAVDIFGGGGVGAIIGLDFSKSGIPIRVFDNKIVGIHNPPNQIFGKRHVGMPKVTALRNIARYLGGTSRIDARTYRVEGDFEHGDVVFVCVDSMAVRKQVMERLFASNTPPKLVIDTRIDTNFIQIYTFIPSNPVHQERYWQYWFADNIAENDGGCNEKRALKCAAGMAADVAESQFIQWFGNGERDLSTAPDNQILITMRPFKAEVYQW